MRKIAFITLLVYVWALSKPLVLIVDYHVNTESIIADFCVNKGDVDLECNGQCYLKRKLEEDQNDDSTPIRGSNDKKQNKLEKKSDSDFFAYGSNASRRLYQYVEVTKFSYLESDSQYLLEIDSPPPNV